MRERMSEIQKIRRQESNSTGLESVRLMAHINPREPAASPVAPGRDFLVWFGEVDGNVS